MNVSRLLRGIVASVMVLLAACSGGGTTSSGDGGGTTPVTPPAAFLDVDPSTPITQAVTNLDTQDTITQAEISEDSNGRRIVRTKVKLVFRKAFTAGDVKRVLATFQAVPTSAVGGAPSIVVRIPDPGSLAALDALIVQIQSDPAIWFVDKAIFPQPGNLPPGYPEAPAPLPPVGPLGKIASHLAVRAHAAWTVRGLLERFGPPALSPVVMMDFFGDDLPNADLNATVQNLDFAGLPLGHFFGEWAKDGHGYHVAGIIAGTFGGSGDSGLVTGMMPGKIDLRVVDLEKWDPLDAQIRLIDRLKFGQEKVVLNTSSGYFCDPLVFVQNLCVDFEYAKKRAVAWIQEVRAEGLENRVLHLTSAGNREKPNYPFLNAETNSDFATAALISDLADEEGKPVPRLTNTLVIENVRGNNGVDSNGTSSPYAAKCLDESSFFGGHLGAIGINVWSFTSGSKSGSLAGSARVPATGFHSGTSMATPQVAGLATYLWALKPTLTVPELKAILMTTARPVPTSSDIICHPTVTPARIIDAYAAVLALDSPAALTSNNPSLAPIRRAILDLTNDGSFTEADLTVWVDKLITNVSTPALLDYSRHDLNGDGYTGGSTPAAFDLDLNQSIALAEIPKTIENEVVTFNEKMLTDIQILCYYAYSSLYQGNVDDRKTLLGSQSCSYVRFLKNNFDASWNDPETWAEIVLPGWPTPGQTFQFDTADGPDPNGAKAGIDYTAVHRTIVIGQVQTGPDIIQEKGTVNIRVPLIQSPSRKTLRYKLTNSLNGGKLVDPDPDASTSTATVTISYGPLYEGLITTTGTMLFTHAPDQQGNVSVCYYDVLENWTGTIDLNQEDPNGANAGKFSVEFIVSNPRPATSGSNCGVGPRDITTRSLAPVLVLGNTVTVNYDDGATKIVFNGTLNGDSLTGSLAYNFVSSNSTISTGGTGTFTKK